MIAAIIALMPKHTKSLSAQEQERFMILGHCYGGRKVPVRGVDFKNREFLVDFHHFNEDSRWQIVDRLAKCLPIYAGLSTTQIYQAGMEHKLRMQLEGFTLLTTNPIPDSILRHA
jgi:hypothetical protein